MKRMFFENANLEFVNEYSVVAGTEMLHVNLVIKNEIILLYSR